MKPKLNLPKLQPTSSNTVNASVENDPNVSQVLGSLPKVNPNDLQIGDQLGHGATSSVCKARYLKNNQLYALKTIKFTQKKEVIQTIVNELHTQSKLDHPNIVHLFSAFYCNNQVHILMQLIDGESLADYLKFSPTIPERALGSLAWQSLQGLYYLRRHHVIHRDLKPSNILISKTGQLGIADFGLAKELRESMDSAQSFIGTICYMAPERLKEQDYSFVSDIWSLGLIIYECAYGKFPFSGDLTSINYWKLSEIAEQILEVDLPSSYSPGLTTFINRCLQLDPNKRANVEQLISDPWVVQYQDPSNTVFLQQYIQRAERKKDDFVAGKDMARSDFQ